MDETIIAVGDLTDTERKRLLYESHAPFCWRRYFSIAAIHINAASGMLRLQLVYKRGQMGAIAAGRFKAFIDSQRGLSAFLYRYFFMTNSRRKGPQATLRGP